jgi:chromosome segregation ATPase
MNARIMRLMVGALSAVMLLAGCGRETEQKLAQTQQQLAAATNEIAATRAELAEVRTKMEAQVSELKQTVSKLTDEKADAEKRAASIKSDFENAQQQFQQERANFASKLTELTDRITEVDRKLADLEKTHATTVTHLQAMRDEYVKLTNEKNALESMLHDLKALTEQVRVVKQEMHAKKVEERKRLDRAEFAMGNHGFLLKNGSWVTPRTPGKYPLTQEIHFSE